MERSSTHFNYWPMIHPWSSNNIACVVTTMRRSKGCSELMREGVVLEIGGAHLREENLEALAWERQVPKIKKQSL